MCLEYSRDASCCQRQVSKGTGIQPESETPLGFGSESLFVFCILVSIWQFKSKVLAIAPFSKAIGHFGLAEIHISPSLGKNYHFKINLSSFPSGCSALV